MTSKIKQYRKLPAGQDPIGIMEFNLMIGNNKSGREKKSTFNLHVLYSTWKNYLIGECLDTGVYSRIDIMDKIKNSDTQSSEKIVKILMNTIIKQHLLDITNHFFNCSENKIVYPFTHSLDVYWSEFRKIRMERDNYNFGLLNDYLSEGIEPFVDLHNKLKEFIKNIYSDTENKVRVNKEIVFGVKRSFIDKIDKLKEAA